MSTNALFLALLCGLLFAMSDRIAMFVGDRFGRNTGSAVWGMLVLVPVIGLAVLSLRVAGVATLVGLVVSYLIGRLLAWHARRNADPFAKAPMPVRAFK
jgi:hypothetical protein